MAEANKSQFWETVLGLLSLATALVGVITIGVGIYHWLNPSPAATVSQVSIATSAYFDKIADGSVQLHIDGTVVDAGTPVNGRVVRVTVDRQPSEQQGSFRESVLTAVKNGTFDVGPQPAFRGLTAADLLKVTTTLLVPGKSAADAPTDQVYLGAPIRTSSFTLSPIAIWSLVVLLITLITMTGAWCFTGDQTYRKVQAAIILSYLIMFSFLAIPLCVPDLIMWLVPSNELNSMANLPVGFAIAKPSKDLDPQWVVNIGGVVDQTATPAKPVASTTPAPAPGTPAAPAPAAPAEPSPSGPPYRFERQRIPGEVTISGGLVIPLFVIILSLIGGAINMTRRIPRFQKEAAAFGFGGGLDLAGRLGNKVIETVQAVTTRSSTPPPDPMAISTDVEPPPIAPPVPKPDPAVTPVDSNTRTARWRQGLLTQHMYLISAPFIAIAVYYLMQWTNKIDTAVLVLVSFSVGLISDKILNSILGIAQTFVPKSGAPTPEAPNKNAPETDKNKVVE